MARLGSPEFSNLMDTTGQSFLDKLAGSSGNGFAVRFSRISSRLDLAAYLNRNELGLLYQASFYATLCNIALNGLGGCSGRIAPEKENIRMGIEREFMAVRNRFWATAGWRVLPATQKQSVRNIFLHVRVFEDNLG